MKKNALIIGGGGVASVAAHKCAQNNDILGNICIASRTVEKCEDIIKKIHREKIKHSQSFSTGRKTMDTIKRLWTIWNRHYGIAVRRVIDYSKGID